MMSREFVLFIYEVKDGGFKLQTEIQSLFVFSQAHGFSMSHGLN